MAVNPALLAMTDEDIAYLADRLGPWFSGAVDAAHAAATDAVGRLGLAIGVGDVDSSAGPDATVSTADNPSGGVPVTRTSSAQTPGERVLILYGPNGQAFAIGTIPLT